jgi:hypothetical protein
MSAIITKSKIQLRLSPSKGLNPKKRKSDNPNLRRRRSHLSRNNLHLQNNKQPLRNDFQT